MSDKRGQVLRWGLDALKVTAAWLAHVYISPFFEGRTDPIPNLVIEFAVLISVLFIGNVLLNILFGLPKLRILWRDPDRVEVTGEEMRVKEGDLGVHSMEAVYECQTFLSKLINSFLAKRATLVVRFDPSAVSVTPELGFTRSGATHDVNRGELLMPLDSAVQNGPVTWCAVQIEPLSVRDRFVGNLDYSIIGSGRAMVFWGWIIRPKTTVRHILVLRSLS